MTKPSFRILTKIQLRNLNQKSAPRLNLKLKSWPNLASESWSRFNFITSKKHQQQNAEQNPASKSCLNLNFKILTNPCAQSLNKSLALEPNVSSQICNKLLPTWSSASTWATVTTSTSFELASSHARATSIKFTKQQLVSRWVSESVRESVSDKHSQWSDSGPIKIKKNRRGSCASLERWRQSAALRVGGWETWSDVSLFLS